MSSCWWRLAGCTAGRRWPATARSAGAAQAVRSSATFFSRAAHAVFRTPHSWPHAEHNFCFPGEELSCAARHHNLPAPGGGARHHTLPRGGAASRSGPRPQQASASAQKPKDGERKGAAGECGIPSDHGTHQGGAGGGGEGGGGGKDARQRVFFGPLDLIKQARALPASWRAVLGREFSKEYFLKLANDLQTKRAVEIVYPPVGLELAALRLCDFDNVRVVIVGQDPVPLKKKETHTSSD
jgi:hypothetical protein